MCRNTKSRRKKIAYKNSTGIAGKSNSQKEFPVGCRRGRNFWQICKFAIVGGLATAVHAGLFVFVIETNIANALQANFIAFTVALLISFLGQYHWTFRHSSDTHWIRKMIKFLVVALIGLSLNTVAVFIIVDKLLLPYLYAVVFMTTVVPVTTFIVNKKWAFS